jgi:predicted Zn-dependent protease
MKKSSILLLALLFLFSCKHAGNVSTAQEQKKSDPLIEKSLLPNNAETSLGESIYNEILKKYKQQAVSQEFETYLTELSTHLGSVTHRTDLKYQIVLLDTKETFAYGLPGGKIVLASGILKIIKNESEFANWIADQMAHIAKQHLVKSLMKNSDYAKMLSEGTIDTQISKQGYLTLSEIGFNVADINEADRLAPAYAIHFGYDHNGLSNLLEQLRLNMSKSGYGKTDQSFDMISHRTSMNQIFVRALNDTDKSQFPKINDRFAAMMKKIKPTPVKKK